MVRCPSCIYTRKMGEINLKKLQKYKNWYGDSILLRNIGENYLRKSDLRSKLRDEILAWVFQGV